MPFDSRPPQSFDLRLSDARLAYGETILVDGLDLHLRAGSWTCLLGASGVGKSSLLRLILGLTAGAHVGGRVSCSDGRPVQGRAAYMSQRDLLMPWLNVFENVVLGHRIRGIGIDDGARERALALLEAVGLGGLDDRRPDTLSGGMRQRVALARTLMENRPLVLMDEPFSGVDAISRVRLQNLAARLLAGRTVLLVTHDPLEALRLGDRIWVMNGRPATLGQPLEPRSPPLRAVDDDEVLELQGDLLRRLADAAG